MSLEQRLKQGPLLVRSLWTDEQTATLADAVSQREQRRALRQRVALSTILATFVAGSAAILLINVSQPSDIAARASAPVSEPLSAQRLPVQASPGQALPGQALPVPVLPEQPAEPMTLADGTRVTLDRGAAFKVFEQTAQAVVCDLTTGAATVEVIPNQPRSFTLRAGEVTVSVIGTVFRVEREGAVSQVSVQRGHVRVSWEGGSQELQTGQRGVFPPAAANDATKAAEQSWSQLAKAGDYKAAYQAFRNQSQPLRRVEELMLAADSARLSGHAAEAIPHLSRVYREFPRDAQAPLAAFTLGRILADQLGRPSQAAEAFRAARGLSSTGPLASDAMAREAECLAQAGSINQARDVAARYLSLFPSGRHREQMQNLVDQN